MKILKRLITVLIFLTACPFIGLSVISVVPMALICILGYVLVGGEKIDWVDKIFIPIEYTLRFTDFLISKFEK